MRAVCLASLWLSISIFANPYPDPKKVPIDPPFRSSSFRGARSLSVKTLRAEARQVLRFDLDWNQSEEYRLTGLRRENSGTEALYKRALNRDTLGSYRGELVDPTTQKVLYYDSLGTGKEFRKLTRALTFRFPVPSRDVIFRVWAENPVTGIQEIVLQQLIIPSTVLPAPTVPVGSIALVREAKIKPALKINFYAEGYTQDSPDKFLQGVERAIKALEQAQFPGFDQMEFWAIYQKSKQRLGSAENLGLPIAERDSFLGLYYPYWNDFGRWYHIVYPTREAKYRNGLSAAPYDYPIVLVDSSEYWGVGNFNEITAIPVGNGSFTYLLLHEFGHFFGLNEEYEGGGPTELSFAPDIEEPWSQNITFHPQELKWAQFVESTTPLPTPSSYWKGNGPWGAYRGGYADTEPLHRSHKPGMNCTMRNGSKFCPICRDAITKKIHFDLGIKSASR